MSCLELALTTPAQVRPMSELWQKRLDLILEAGRAALADEDGLPAPQLMLVDGRALADVRDGVKGLASANLALLIGREADGPANRAEEARQAVSGMMLEAARLGLDPMLVENPDQDQLRELVALPGRCRIDGVLFIGHQPTWLSRGL